MDGVKLASNIFFSITCMSAFTCIYRSDYNFAFGLLCYYMLQTGKDQASNVAKPVSSLNISEFLN
jgi:hypothetical protein